MGSRSSANQTQSQQTIQTDRRAAASDNAIVATEGARIGSSETNISGGRDVTIQSLDPETIKGAFGLSQSVVDQLSALAGGAVRDSQNTVERVAGSTAGTLERVASGFGQQVSDLALAKETGGLSQITKFIPWIIGAILAFLYFNRKRA